jgi:catechol 2,3-dioxygenase-like lactoylglutathione lyase family enzyme
VGEQLFASTPDAGAWLTFHKTDSETAGTMGGVAHFGFALDESESLDEALRQAKQAGRNVLERGEHMPGMPYALVADLDGYIFEL